MATVSNRAVVLAHDASATVRKINQNWRLTFTLTSPSRDWCTGTYHSTKERFTATSPAGAWKKGAVAILELPTAVVV